MIGQKKYIYLEIKTADINFLCNFYKDFEDGQMIG